MSTNAGKPTWGSIGSQTVQLFRTEFPVYFSPVLLASTIAYICVYLLELIREEFVPKPIIPSFVGHSNTAIPNFLILLGKALVWTVECWVVWLAFTIVLAMVSLRMLQQRQFPDGRIPISGIFQQILKGHLGVLAGISGLAGLSTALFNTFLIPLLLKPLPYLMFRLHLFDSYFIVRKCAVVALTLVFAALISKITLAVPELVEDPNVIFEHALRNSDKATTGWEGFFLLECISYGLLGGVLYFAGNEFIRSSWKSGRLTLQGYEIMLAAFTILLASLIILLVIIAHSLLYISLKYSNVSLPAEATDMQLEN